MTLVISVITEHKLANVDLRFTSIIQSQLFLQFVTAVESALMLMS